MLFAYVTRMEPSQTEKQENIIKFLGHVWPGLPTQSTQGGGLRFLLKSKASSLGTGTDPSGRLVRQIDLGRQPCSCAAFGFAHRRLPAVIQEHLRAFWGLLKYGMSVCFCDTVPYEGWCGVTTSAQLLIIEPVTPASCKWQSQESPSWSIPELGVVLKL
eukprot:774644-Amphidinium_carterae.1